MILQYTLQRTYKYIAQTNLLSHIKNINLLATLPRWIEQPWTYDTSGENEKFMKKTCWLCQLKTNQLIQTVQWKVLWFYV